uniref:Uncharacterized protein n=1 Tax=Knipowitschia caucasica TaxID=637954 RepID=A0AAV2JYB5_KNICA
MLQFDSPGAPHDETETQLKTEQSSSCEPAKNQEPSPQSCLNQEPAPQNCLNQEPAPQNCLNQEPAPQNCLNQEPGPKTRRKQKPAKDLQGGLEEPKTPIESFSTSERGNSPPIAPAQTSLSNTETQQVESIRNNLPSDEREKPPPIKIRYSLPSDEREGSPPIKIRYSLPSDERERSPPIKIRYSLPSDERERSPPIKIRYSLPSDERERSPPIAVRYSLPSDAPFMPLHLIPDQGSTEIMKKHEISSQWDTVYIYNLAWEVSRHILQEKPLSLEHPLVMKLYQKLEEQMWEWNVKESPKK